MPGCSKYVFVIKIAVLPLQKNTVAYSKIFVAFGYSSVLDGNKGDSAR